RGLFLGCKGPKMAVSGLRIEDGAENGDDEMSEMFGAFVKLKPANYAMLAEIFCDASFGNAKMIGQKRLDVDAGAAIAAATREIADGDTKRVAGLGVVVGSHFLVGENENTGTSRG